MISLRCGEPRRSLKLRDLAHQAFLSPLDEIVNLHAGYLHFLARGVGARQVFVPSPPGCSQ
jgi:hypothetical protein